MQKELSKIRITLFTRKIRKSQTSFTNVILSKNNPLFILMYKFFKEYLDKFELDIKDQNKYDKYKQDFSFIMDKIFGICKRSLSDREEDVQI